MRSSLFCIPLMSVWTSFSLLLKPKLHQQFRQHLQKNTHNVVDDIDYFQTLRMLCSSLAVPGNATQTMLNLAKVGEDVPLYQAGFDTSGYTRVPGCLSEAWLRVRVSQPGLGFSVIENHASVRVVGAADSLLAR